MPSAAGVPDESMEVEEEEVYIPNEGDSEWMNEPMFDTSMPSFAESPPDGVNPTGPAAGDEWTGCHRSVRSTLTRKDAGNKNFFMKYLRRAAHQEAYNEAAEDCLAWVKDVRLKRA